MDVSNMVTAEVAQQGMSVMNVILTALCGIIVTASGYIGKVVKRYFDKKFDNELLGDLKEDIYHIVQAADDEFEVSVKKAKHDDGIVDEAEFRQACNNAFIVAREKGKDFIKHLPEHLWPIAERKLEGYIETALGQHKATRALAKAVNPSPRTGSV